jgi:hypothetical protein
MDGSGMPIAERDDQELAHSFSFLPKEKADSVLPRVGFFFWKARQSRNWQTGSENWHFLLVNLTGAAEDGETDHDDNYFRKSGRINPEIRNGNPE